MVQAQNARTVFKDAFWERDLGQIESDFLGGRKITELPVNASDDRVPIGGCVLDEFVDGDVVVERPSMWLVQKEKLRRLLFK